MGLGVFPASRTILNETKAKNSIQEGAYKKQVRDIKTVKERANGIVEEYVARIFRACMTRI